MKAGPVWMEFDDGTAGWVPNDRIGEAKVDGGVISKPPQSRTMMGRPIQSEINKAAMGQMGNAGGIAGSSVGEILGTAAMPFMGPAAPAGPVAGRVIGGAIGGGIGKAGEELGYRALGYGDAPGTVVGEAALQGGFGLGGELAAGVVGGVGRAFVRTGLPAKVADASKAVGEMVRKRIPVGSAIPKVLKSGGEKAVRNWANASGVREAALSSASLQGLTIPRKVAEDAITGLVNSASKDMAEESEVRFLRSRLRSWGLRKAPDIPASEVQSIITRFNAKAKPVYDAMKRKGSTPPSSAMQARALYHKTVAEKLTAELENALPGYKELNSNLSNAIAAKNAVGAAEAAGARSLASRFATGATIGGSIDALSGERNPVHLAQNSAMAGAALASPTALSHVGLALTDPYLAFLLRNSPRFLPRGQQ